MTTRAELPPVRPPARLVAADALVPQKQPRRQPGSPHAAAAGPGGGGGGAPSGAGTAASSPRAVRAARWSPPRAAGSGADDAGAPVPRPLSAHQGRRFRAAGPTDDLAAASSAELKPTFLPPAAPSAQSSRRPGSASGHRPAAGARGAALKWSPADPVPADLSLAANDEGDGDSGVKRPGKRNSTILCADPGVAQRIQNEVHDVPRGGEALKRTKITLDAILKKNALQDSRATPEETIAAVFRATHIRLDGCGIENIENLECLGPVTNLYLHNNSIRHIENIECLTQLRFLTLANNLIEELRGLTSLRRLVLLDVSDNLIKCFEPAQCPKTLTFLHLEGNPCVTEEGYRQRAIRSLPQLQGLDAKLISARERKQAEGGDASDADADDEDEFDDHDEDDEDYQHYVQVMRSSATGPTAELQERIAGMSATASAAELQERIRRRLSEAAAFGRSPQLESTRDAIIQRSKARQAQEKNEYTERVQQLKSNTSRRPPSGSRERFVA